MANEKDIFNQTTGDLSDSHITQRLEDFEQRLVILEKRVGRTTRELGAHGSNISKELEELNQELERLKAARIVQNLNDDLKRQCIYCGNGVYRKIINGRNVEPHAAVQRLMEYGVEMGHQNSFK